MLDLQRGSRVRLVHHPSHTASPSPVHLAGPFPSCAGRQISPGELGAQHTRSQAGRRIDPHTQNKPAHAAPTKPPYTTPHQSPQPPTNLTYSPHQTPHILPHQIPNSPPINQIPSHSFYHQISPHTQRPNSGLTLDLRGGPLGLASLTPGMNGVWKCVVSLRKNTERGHTPGTRLTPGTPVYALHTSACPFHNNPLRSLRD